MNLRSTHQFITGLCPPYADVGVLFTSIRAQNVSLDSHLGLFLSTHDRLLPNESSHYWYELLDMPMGKTYVFVGNSITRQVYQRLIQWLRQIPFFVEKYAHLSMWYAFDYTRDHWNVGAFEGVRGDYDHARLLASVERATGFMRGQYSLLLFDYAPAVDCSRMQEAVGLFADGLMCQAITKNRKTSLLWGLTRYNIGDSMNLEYLFLDVDKVMRSGSVEAWPLRNNRCFDLNLPKRCTGVIWDAHFQCAYEPFFDWDYNASFVKFPSNGDCTDGLNLNIAQRFLSWLLDTRV
ncbi:hypothetical protein B484DRAFT_396497 [Ochromonadaceae sp. CCMP2298]|nr:hypothetical protein B484DRAFT_396497 [Ochromonadaceae sp. CCMP2298]